MSHVEPEHNRPPEGEEPDEPFPIMSSKHPDLLRCGTCEPKPTGEWTVESVRELVSHHDGCKRVADAHNAALAAEREKRERIQKSMESWQETADKLNMQLAAEREKTRIVAHHEEHECPSKGLCDLCRVKRKLAAEREKVDSATEDYMSLSKWLFEAKQQLVAEREAFKSYVESVNHADRHNSKWQERAEKSEQQLAAERERAEASEYNFAVQVDETKRLTAELEHERMCHAACGVIAMSNTRESLEENRAMKSEYLSASVQDCIKAAEREIELREQLAAEREKVKLLGEELAHVCKALKSSGLSLRGETETALQLAAEREITFASQQAALKEGIRADELAKQLDAERGAKNHMEACRALLNVPDDEVLYSAIEELQHKLTAAVEALKSANQIALKLKLHYPSATGVDELIKVTNG